MPQFCSAYSPDLHTYAATRSGRVSFDSSAVRCDSIGMLDRSRKKRSADLNRLAASIVADATAEDDEHDDPYEGKNPAAVELGRQGLRVQLRPPWRESISSSGGRSSREAMVGPGGRRWARTSGAAERGGRMGRGGWGRLEGCADCSD